MLREFPVGLNKNDEFLNDLDFLFLIKYNFSFFSTI